MAETGLPYCLITQWEATTFTLLSVKTGLRLLINSIRKYCKITPSSLLCFPIGNPMSALRKAAVWMRQVLAIKPASDDTASACVCWVFVFWRGSPSKQHLHLNIGKVLPRFGFAGHFNKVKVLNCDDSFKMYLQVCEAQAHVAFLLGRILVYEHVIHMH